VVVIGIGELLKYIEIAVASMPSDVVVGPRSANVATKIASAVLISVTQSESECVVVIKLMFPFELKIYVLLAQTLIGLLLESVN